MTDSALVKAVEKFHVGETLSESELDALLELYHDLLYKLRIAEGDVPRFRSTLNFLESELRTLEGLIEFRDNRKSGNKTLTFSGEHRRIRALS